MRYGYSQIQNEAAYEQAIRDRIKANAVTGRNRRWLESDPSRSDLVEWMRGQTSPFIAKMVDSYFDWGSLTEKQESAIRASRDNMAARKLANEQARTEKAKTAQHVGTEGKREVFGPLTVKHIAGFEGHYGYVTIYSMEDSDGNVIVYKGTAAWEGIEKGSVLSVKATVKKHDEYKGLAQTVISRPVII